MSSALSLVRNVGLRTLALASRVPGWGWAVAGAAAVGGVLFSSREASAAEGGSSGVSGPLVPVSPGLNSFSLADQIPARDAQILEYVKNGSYQLDWVPLTWTKGGRTASILVSRRALAIVQEGTRLTVNATMPTAQKVADAIGGAMLTTRISDEIARQAAVRLPVTSHAWQGPGTDNSGSSTGRMFDQSALLDEKVGGAPGLVLNEGKDWVLTRRFWVPPTGTNDGTRSVHNAANFGWYPGGSSSPGGMKVIQSIGLTHDMGHTDYSQLLRFVRPDSLTIDGSSVDYATALADPDLSSVIQDEGGTLPLARHPDL